MKALIDNNVVKILLIEDLTSDANAISRSISYGNFAGELNITRVVRLREALEKLHNGEEFDIILLDLSLPDAKDIKALVELKKSFADIPVIVLSDQSDEAIKKSALANGAVKYLLKSETSGLVIKRNIVEVLNW